MIANYFKIAIRNILRYKVYSLINIFGLAIGLAIFSLTADLFRFQLSFNNFHKDADRIYSIVQVLPSGTTGVRHTTKTHAPLRNLLLEEFSEIEDATRWIPADRVVVRQGTNKFYLEEGTFWFVDPNFLTFFSFEILAGDAETALLEPNSVVLTESVARKLFGEVNVLGRMLATEKGLDLMVKGVTRDVPFNSSVKYDVLVSLTTYNVETNWNVKGATFIRLAKTARPNEVEQKFPAFIKKYLSDSPFLPQKIYLLALKDLNLKSFGIRTYWSKEIPEIVYLTFVIGVIMLLAVCFNYMNLATAGYFMRAKEVGVRKVIGASRKQLMWQFLGESVLFSLLAFPAGNRTQRNYATRVCLPGSIRPIPCRSGNMEQPSNAIGALGCDDSGGPHCRQLPVIVTVSIGTGKNLKRKSPDRQKRRSFTADTYCASADRHHIFRSGHYGVI